MKFWDNIGDPSCFPTPLLDCLCHVSFSRHSPLSLAVVEKPNKCESFVVPNFFREGRPQLFYGRLLARPTVHHLAKCGWDSFCWSLSTKRGNEVECRIYRGWVKTHFQFEAVSGQKFMSFWGNVGDPLRFATHLHAYVYRVSFRRYRPLKLSLSCEIDEKGSFWAPGL